jgi:hypothetical protein
MRRTTVVAAYVLLVAFGLVPTTGYFVRPSRTARP